MSRSINGMIDDDAWRLLEKMPSRERSQTVSNALLIWATRGRRRAAVSKTRLPGAQLPKLSKADVMRWIREDWEHGC